MERKSRAARLRMLGVGERTAAPRTERKTWDEAACRLARRTGRRFHVMQRGDLIVVVRVV